MRSFAFLTKSVSRMREQMNKQVVKFDRQAVEQELASLKSVKTDNVGLQKSVNKRMERLQAQMQNKGYEWQTPMMEVLTTLEGITSKYPEFAVKPRKTSKERKPKGKEKVTK